MGKILSLKNRLKKPIFGVIFAVLALFGLINSPLMTTPVYAEPTAEVSTEETCYDQVGAIGWLVCPTTGVLGKAIDAIYGQIEKLLEVDPVVSDNSSPIYSVWQVMRDVTNIVFIVFLLIVVYSQITGLGITNYGLKKALPKLIIAAVMVNLSYLVCALLVDVSNIAGASLRGLFESIQNTAIAAGGLGDGSGVTWTGLAGALIGGGAIAGISIGAMGGLSTLIWPAIAALICGILSVIVGLITIGLRQALISVLIMIAPLAMVAYLLPNTEQWFKKWKDIFFSMLIFYPMFSFLFGAAQLAGWALIASSVSKGSGFGIVVGMAVQVLPLILSVSLMKMSGTVLGTISSKLDNAMNKPKTGIRAAMEPQRQLAKSRYVNNSLRPSAKLQQFLDKQQRKTELDMENETKIRRGNAEIWAQRRILGIKNYDPANNAEYRKGKDGAEAKNLKPNVSTRAAKMASNVELAAQTAVMDTEHVIAEYSDHHDTKPIDKRLNKQSAKNYLNYYRAGLVKENDAYADEEFVMGSYNEFRNAFKTDNQGRLQLDEDGKLIPKSAEALKDYDRYIVGAAGALGERGAQTVLGEVISRSAANEAKRRAYTNYFHSKWGYNKRDARNMIVGFYNDDDGFAVNRDTGERIWINKKDESGNWILDENGDRKKFYERVPGEFLQFHPEAIAQYSTYETYDIDPKTGEKLYYYNETDKDGNFIAKVYKSDTPAMKEILSNWDMQINDPINTLYGILAGNKQGNFSSVGLEGVGLGALSTTIQRALSSYKEKDASVGPMFATSVGQGFVTNATQSLWESFDNYMKTGKPGSFNIQDAATFARLNQAINPDNWEDLMFDEAALRSRRNVNGSHLKGIALEKDAAGNYIYDANGRPKIARRDIPVDQASREELVNGVIDKFFNGNFGKFANMMSRITPNTIDNQKPSTQEEWNKLYLGLLSMSEIADENDLIPDEVPIDDKKMSPEEIREAERKNKAAKEARAEWRKKLFERYPLLKDPLSSMGGDTIQNANRLRGFSRKMSAMRNPGKGGGNNNGGGNTGGGNSGGGSSSSNLPASGSSSYYRPEELQKEAAIMDAEWEQEYGSGSDDEDYNNDYIGEQPYENSKNYRVHIDMLAAQYADFPDAFCDQTLQYLQGEAAENPRLDTVILEFERIIGYHTNDPTYSTEDFKAELYEWLPLAEYDE